MAKYRLAESKIRGERAKVKCSRCQHMFFVSREVPPPQEPPMQLSIEETPTKSVQDLFDCPNCGFQQPHSQECMKCGIIFSKFKPREEMMPPSYSQYSPGYGLDGSPLDDGTEATSMTYAGFWPRFGAHLIDGVVAGILVKISMWLAMLPMTYYFSQDYMSGNQPLESLPPALPMALFLGVSLSVVLPALYYILMWGYKGATLGKMALKIKIVRTGGSDISYGTASLRYIGTIISGMLFGLGYLWMLWDDKNQTWHDKIASTYVIRSK
jgi:predicted Zn finger-like uncharacterized protein